MDEVALGPRAAQLIRRTRSLSEENGRLIRQAQALQHESELLLRESERSRRAVLLAATVVRPPRN